MYADDPGGRSSDQSLLRPVSQLPLFDRPWNSETDVHALDSSYLTPAEALYVRNHAPVPQHLRADNHTLTFGIGSYADDDVSDLCTISLLELQDRYGAKQVTSVLQCSGNRAAENIAANGTDGLHSCCVRFWPLSLYNNDG